MTDSKLFPPRTPAILASRAVHTGCVEIIAVDSATVVSRRLGIHVPKCAASATPGPSAALAPSGSLTRREVSSIQPNVRAHASRHRYMAMASEGAAHAAISGAEALTQMTATASSSQSRPEMDPLRRDPPD